ncbi:hypothetical protein ACFVYA_39785 [Amycolatopsis sp. NPDC058278]|uniref:hypothetical protein n=1 Tax=Amycolatopsis sp. NPDC058278 TaxID=3346417 RepID=UPI0036D9FA56
MAPAAAAKQFDAAEVGERGQAVIGGGDQPAAAAEAGPAPATRASGHTRRVCVRYAAD